MVLKKRLAQMVDGLIVVAAVTMGSLGAMWAAPQSARLTASPMIIGAAAILVGAALAWSLGWLIGRKSGRRRRAAAGTTLATLAVGSLVVWIMNPPPRLYPPVSVPANIQFWNLPTGSRIAYRRMPGAAPHRPSPVIIMHGGPGAPILPLLNLVKGDVPFDSLMGLGYDLYFYDQYGAGYSSRADLSHDAPYTVDRQIDDLEAIRQAIGTQRLILIGTSCGATLAARYVLRFPEHVERIVFDSPGPIWFPAFPQIESPDANRPLTADERAQLDVAQRPTPRIVVGRMLAQVNPRAGTRLVKDWEVDEWFGNSFYAAIQLGQPRSSCRGVLVPPKEYFATMGFFVFNYMVEDAFRLPDPRPELRKRTLPVLVLRGECDWIRPEIAREYRDVFTSAHLVAVPNAAHMTWLEQPDLVQRIVAAFLLDKELPTSADGRDAEEPRK